MAVYLYVRQAVLRRAIVALEAQAHDIAGHSQGDDLVSAEETQEWADAQELRKDVKEAGLLRRVLKSHQRKKS